MKIKNENVATFLDVYDVPASKFCHFSHFTREMKVIQLFKATKEMFRDKKQKGGKLPKFPPFGLCSSGRDENRFFSVLEPETLRKPMLLGTVC